MIKLGWIKDRDDKRDWQYAWRLYRGKIPRRVDLRERCSPIRSQCGGSCVGNSVAGNIEYVDKQQLPFRIAAPLFLYFNARVVINMADEDSGCHIRDAAKLSASKGVCAEELWPQTDENVLKRPTPACYEDALDHQVTSYWRLQGLDEIKACLAEGFPVVLGFYVYPSCMTDEVTRTGHIPFPSCIERYRREPLGGHAVMAVGYNDDTEEVTIRNSWGVEWGDDGYGYLPYKFITKGLADDFWTIRKIEE